jgi:predicted O-methyltransferase YrrM
MSMTYLPNWFQNDGLENFSLHLVGKYAGEPVKFLQVGAYTGDASLWLMDNVLTHPDAVLVDIDTWEGSNEPVHYSLNWKSVEQTYDEKLADYVSAGKIIKYKGTSDGFFKQNTDTFDFIYIDGDHTAYGVIKDAVNSYEVLNDNGILAFDDYEWSAGLGVHKEPRMAIDAFLNIYQDKVRVIFREYQCWVRKVPTLEETPEF